MPRVKLRGIFKGKFIMKAFERFIKYASFETTSNEANDNCPSSEGQLSLANYLKDELLSLGLSDARVDKNGYVYASLPANSKEKCNAIGFIAHLDTSPEASGKDIKMNLVDYKGGDVLLNPEKKIWMRAQESIALLKLKQFTIFIIVKGKR